MNKKYNSFNDQYAQQIRNNQNTMELLTKIDQALNTNEAYVTAKTVDADGKEVSSQITTIGFFKQKLDQLTKMVKTLSGIEGNPTSLQIANNAFKRIITADINKQPNNINDVSPVSVFKTDPNWIFDSFLNPKISVSLDLTGKLRDDIKTIMSRRYIVKFETVYNAEDDVAVLTIDGEARLAEFNSKYKGKSNIDYDEFNAWLLTNGLVNKVDSNLIDQDTFKMDANRLKYSGNFSILSTQIDSLNKKLWYVLDTLTYQNISNANGTTSDLDLKLGDLVNVNPSQAGVKSTTVYKIIEISTINSEIRVRLENVFGEEPVSVRLDALSIYSELVPERTVRISVGFDEFCVIFIKPVDEINNLEANKWSTGVGFYTNELRLNDDSGQLFSDYYINSVNDYGAVLEDLVSKKIPNFFAVKPNKPVLSADNFKVVQTNAHLTQTVEAEKVRDLHNEKNDLNSKINQISTSIEKQNRILTTTKFESNADKKRADDELVALQAKLNTTTQTKVSIVNDILANKKNLNKITPKYNVRGFFPFPLAVDKNPDGTALKTNPQEIVQFEIWYRKLSKSGAENPILTITDINNENAVNANNKTTLGTNIAKPKVVNGAFSNWQMYKSDARKRKQDPVTLLWYWTIEDVTDANTPNINQIDLEILPGEKIEIKVKSLSEAGWPETPAESDFSDVITVEFPDDLNNVLNEDEFILKEAQNDQTVVAFERILENKGVNLHLQSALRDAENYYPHLDKAIATSFKDANGKIINLYDQLLAMVNKINSLEETINRAKGVLEIYLVQANNQIRLASGSNLKFNINLEDYMTKTKIGLVNNPVDSVSRTYKNELLVIKDYSLLIKNTAQTANLGLLSYRGYGKPTGFQTSEFAYDGSAPTNDVSTPGVSLAGKAMQALWTTQDSSMLVNTIAANDGGLLTLAPKYATQSNNQWIWLQLKDLESKHIYNTSSLQPENQFFDDDVSNISNGASPLHNAVINVDYNVGFLTGVSNSTQDALTISSTAINQITDDLIWNINEDPLSGATKFGKMGSTIHPAINTANDIVDLSSQLIKIIKPGESNNISIPLNIYAKPYTGTGVYSDPAPTNNTPFNESYVIDLPNINTANPATEIGNFLRLNMDIITSPSSFSNLKIGDRIVLDGFTDPQLVPINGKVLTITQIPVSPNIIVNYTVTTGFSYSQTGGSLKQLHKKYITDGVEMNEYNVLGTEKYVDNYVEIVGKTTSPTPKEHNKKLRFYLEDENNVRPFEFQLNWNIVQYRKSKLSNITTSNIQTQARGL